MVLVEPETLEPAIDEHHGKLEGVDNTVINDQLIKKPSEKMKSKKKKKRKEMKKRSEGKNHSDDADDEFRLVWYWELPDYMKENEYIMGYYRAEWPLSRAFLSLFSWHNETINVWTHLVGFLMFFWLTLLHLNRVPQLSHLLGHLPWSISSSPVENSSSNQANFFAAATSRIKLDAIIPSYQTPQQHLSSPPTTARWPFFVFLGGSMFCLLCSSSCHLLCCHSHRLSLFLSRLDYVGIAVMIVASFFPPMYYIFQCEPHWQLLYLSTITVIGILTVLALLSPHLSTSAFRSYRALLFCAMGLSGLIPATHAVIVNWTEPRRTITLAYEVAMALSYLTGTFFYVSRIPERWKPGWFDLTGHSHQIFHVFVIAGALAHYCAALIFLEWRDSVGCDRIL